MTIKIQGLIKTDENEFTVIESKLFKFLEIPAFNYIELLHDKKHISQIHIMKV